MTRRCICWCVCILMIFMFIFSTSTVSVLCGQAGMCGLCFALFLLYPMCNEPLNHIQSYGTGKRAYRRITVKHGLHRCPARLALTIDKLLNSSLTHTGS